jgi:hypothetical protein
LSVLGFFLFDYINLRMQVAQIDSEQLKAGYKIDAANYKAEEALLLLGEHRLAKNQ